jgi:hypothetical protein
LEGATRKLKALALGVSVIVRLALRMLIGRETRVPVSEKTRGSTRSCGAGVVRYFSGLNAEDVDYKLRRSLPSSERPAPLAKARASTPWRGALCMS